MPEYASIRLMLSCVIATRLPMKREKMAISASGKYQRLEIEGKVAMKTRPMAAKAADLVATDMKVVTIEGAPSYTSGVHMWKGAADALKASPTVRNPMPSNKRTLPPAFEEAAVVKAAIPRRVVLPVAP